MPTTALHYFKEDIGRAEAICAHANTQPTGTGQEKLLRSDLLRSAWMFAIGALDAYFCDAYSDLVAATISSKSRQKNIALPDWLYEIKFPIRTILEDYTKENWRWRMAAQDMMDRENVLSLERIQQLFNRFFRKGHRFFGDVIDGWIKHADAKKRLFGITTAAYQSLAGQPKEVAKKKAQEQLEDRFADLFQRRHDCIHNCDRPRRKPQPLAASGIVLKVIQDVGFLVNRCDEHINAEVKQFLVDIGCNAATIAAARY
jgi:predicted secreted protein